MPALINALSDENRFVRGSAAEALGNICEPAKEVMSALINALGDVSECVRGTAAIALGGIGEPAVSELIVALDAYSWQLLMHAARALGEGKVAKAAN